MNSDIKVIELPLPLRMGSVNCYLVMCAGGWFLIDTGSAHSRENLVAELRNASCTTDSLKLILLTHGDFDHTGNAAYLRSTFGAPIAIHRDDSGMVERGDMFVNRKKPNCLITTLIPIFMGFGKSERFIPDLLLEDGYEFSEHGLQARVISLPGHSMGSIGILTEDGDLFCGDLFENIKSPKLNSLIDDPEAAQASLLKLQGNDIKMVYPGHGHPFSWEQIQNQLA